MASSIAPDFPTKTDVVFIAIAISMITRLASDELPPRRRMDMGGTDKDAVLYLWERMMEIHPRFHQALSADHAMWRLREEVRQLLAAGYDRTLLIAQLESFHEQLREAGRDADDDSVLEVLDFLTGWCRPGMQL